jgi:biotin-independent malonate decarboxylase gamma subunit
LAFDDDGVMIHAMHKEAAARITRRSVENLDKLGKTIPPLSYDVRDFARLGLLHKLLHVEDPDHPSETETGKVRDELLAAIEDARHSPWDLRSRLESKEARDTRRATIRTRALLETQWREEAGQTGS